MSSATTPIKPGRENGSLVPGGDGSYNLRKNTSRFAKDGGIKVPEQPEMSSNKGGKLFSKKTWADGRQ